LVSSAIRKELEEYAAGRGSAERVVIAAAAAYYRGSGDGNRDALEPLIQVIDRASPGIVELGSVGTGAGFEVRLGERPFPATYEHDLRRAATEALAGLAAARPSNEGLLRRMLGAIQKLFSA